MRAFTIILIGLFLFTSIPEVEAQSEKRFHKIFVPYQWEIYNTIYKKTYWDRRDNYDYVHLKSDRTFQRRYQGSDMSGKWKYNKRKKLITLTITEPFKKAITFKVEKISSKTFVYTSSEENYKVKMYMKKGDVPKSPLSRFKKKKKKKN